METQAVFKIVAVIAIVAVKLYLPYSFFIISINSVHDFFPWKRC